MKVVVEINQQQEELIRRLIEEGEHGSTPAEVIRAVLLLFCSAHPELLGASGSARAS